MDGFETPVIVAYKAKTKAKAGQPKKETQPKKDKKQKNKKPEKLKRSDDKTLTAIGKSTGEDVCCCVRVLAEYVKEALRLVLCSPPAGQKGDKFGTMFCELGDVTIRLLHDAFNFIKFLVKSIICAVTTVADGNKD